MSKTSKCSECGNKKWKRKDKDNFICIKCRQQENLREAKVIKIDIGCGFVLVRHMKNGELEYAEIYKESGNLYDQDDICIYDYYRCGDEDTLIVNFLLNHMECALYALQHRDKLEFMIDPLFRAGLFKKCNKDGEE